MATDRLTVRRTTDSLGRPGWVWECADQERPRRGFHREHGWTDFMRKTHGLTPRLPAQARCMDAARAHLTLRHRNEEPGS